MRISDWSSDVCSSDLITTPISTRTLIRWARLLLMFSRGRGALKFSFDHAFGDGLDETDAARLNQAAELVFVKGQNDKSIWSEAPVRLSCSMAQTLSDRKRAV